MSTAQTLPDTDPLDSLPEERRSEGRYGCRLKVLYRTEVKETRCGDTWVMAKVVDVSRNGIAIVTRRKYPPGTMVQLVVMSPGWQRDRHLEARVTNVSPAPDSEWRSGCELTEPLRDGELQFLLQGAG
ncbi:MAG TPA: PilZ domain-containing protein [Gemmataceae bacterium]|jgi:hypothetical protein|nr:PilZ domain-containing protein [Gemmataceae bacterium]HEV3443477.1 PilZ domain-containing protein [Gemmataceae bacterium]